MTLDDLRNKAARKLNEVLRGLVVGEACFRLCPSRLNLKK